MANSRIVTLAQLDQNDQNSVAEYVLPQTRTRSFNEFMEDRLRNEDYRLPLLTSSSDRTIVDRLNSELTEQERSSLMHNFVNGIYDEGMLRRILEILPSETLAQFQAVRTAPISNYENWANLLLYASFGISGWDDTITTLNHFVNEFVNPSIETTINAAQISEVHEEQQDDFRRVVNEQHNVLASRSFFNINFNRLLYVAGVAGLSAGGSWLFGITPSFVITAIGSSISRGLVSEGSGNRSLSSSSMEIVTNVSSTTSEVSLGVVFSKFSEAFITLGKYIFKGND